MNMAEEMHTLTPGELANNGMFVQGLQKLLTGSEYNLEVLVRVVKDMKANGSWRAFMRNEQVFRYGPADFRKFIEADRPAGCQTPLYILERLLRGTDGWEALLELTRGEPGNPTGVNQYTEEQTGNCDNITDSSSPPPTGTSVSYAVRRLSRERPDLYEQVKTRKLTANAAMIEAGFREPQLTIPLDPRKAARRFAKHFTREQFSAFVDECLKLYQDDGEVP